MSERLHDLTGHVYGAWTVTAFSHLDERRTSWWHATCACGTKRVQRGWVLTSGKSVRCSECSSRELSRRSIEREEKLLRGTVVGGWTVVHYSRTVLWGGKTISMWVCRCTACAAVVDVPRTTLGKPTMPVCHHGEIPEGG